jgi:hypothetical protein
MSESFKKKKADHIEDIDDLFIHNKPMGNPDGEDNEDE